MAPQSLLQINIEALKQYNHRFASWLCTQPVNHEKIQNGLVRNRWGLRDWPLSTGKGMFESVHPKNVYRSWAEKNEDTPAAAIIVGCNLGFGLTYMLSNTADSDKLFVVEPNPEMLMVCLNQTDYRPYLEAERIHFMLPDAAAISDTIFSHLKLYFEFGQIRMFADLPSQQMGPEYAMWFQTCKEILDDFRLDMNSIRGHQDTLIRNELDNFNRALQDGSLRALKNQAKGLTAVQFGAGPSLEKFAPNISKDPGDALLSAAFQSLPVLQKYQLKPHLCVIIDPTSVMKDFYKRLSLKWIRNIPLIYSCKVLPEVVASWPGPTLPMWTTGGIGAHIWNGRELVLNTGANVGIAITRFLTWCGISKLLLVGQDFAWAGENIHADETSNSAFISQRNSNKIRKLQNRQGEEIFSNVVYMTALRTFEREVETSNISVYNLYGGFAIINGTKDVTWKDVLARNLLTSQEGRLDLFRNKIHEAHTSIKRPRIISQTSELAASIKLAEEKIDLLINRAGSKQQEIISLLEELLSFMGHNSLYRTYLNNEINTISGMLFTRKQIGLKEFVELKEYFKEMISKALEIDQKLANHQDRKQLTYRLANIFEHMLK